MQHLAIYKFRIQLQIKKSLPQSLRILKCKNPPTQRLIWWETAEFDSNVFSPSKYETQQLAIYEFRIQLQLKTSLPQTYKSTHSALDLVGYPRSLNSNVFPTKYEKQQLAIY